MSRLMRSVLLLLFAAAIALPLAGCGRKNPPTLPNGEQDQFPHDYPRH